MDEAAFTAPVENGPAPVVGPEPLALYSTDPVVPLAVTLNVTEVVAGTFTMMLAGLKMVLELAPGVIVKLPANPAAGLMFTVRVAAVASGCDPGAVTVSV